MNDSILRGRVSENYRIEDFTESEYREMLRLAGRHWRFASFSETGSPDRLALWRHDVDLSPQRSLRLGQIEAEEGARATYFVLLHSEYYNALESGVLRIFRDLLNLGHEVGLHFDPNVYGCQVTDEGSLKRWMHFESRILSEYLEAKIDAVSFHNPTVGPLPISRKDSIAGMVNAYGASLSTRFSYVSDSNGYWRFRRLRDVLESGSDHSIQVLTHPEWWTPEPLRPRDRISRCIDGRASRQHRFYDSALEEFGRANVK